MITEAETKADAEVMLILDYFINDSVFYDLVTEDDNSYYNCSQPYISLWSNCYFSDTSQLHKFTKDHLQPWASESFFSSSVDVRERASDGVKGFISYLTISFLQFILIWMFGS